MWIVLWILSALLQAVWWSFRKKAIDNSNIPSSLFAILWPIIGAIIVYTIIYFTSFNVSIFLNYKFLLLIVLIATLEIINNYIEIYSFRKTKISNLLPYDNTNKLLIILIWFFIYYWTKNSTSIITFLITLLTIFIIISFSIDFKNIKIDKIIWIYLFWKALSATTWLIIWYILLTFTTIEYMSVNVLIAFSIYFIITLVNRNNFSILLKQNKIFYKSRLFALILWWTWFLISLYIIQSSWLLIATLIWFIWLIFKIFSMKFILNDNPTKKQILLAFMVSILIWLWYYFK